MCIWLVLWKLLPKEEILTCTLPLHYHPCRLVQYTASHPIRAGVTTCLRGWVSDTPLVQPSCPRPMAPVQGSHCIFSTLASLTLCISNCIARPEFSTSVVTSQLQNPLIAPWSHSSGYVGSSLVLQAPKPLWGWSQGGEGWL